MMLASGSARVASMAPDIGTIVLTLGVALIGALATVVVTYLTLRARKRELDAEIIARLSQEGKDRQERVEQRRADAIEEISEAIVDHIETLKQLWVALDAQGLVGPGKAVPLPPETGLARSFNKLVTRLHEPRLRDAAFGTLDAARGKIPLHALGSVYAVLEARLMNWFLEIATTDETITAMHQDAALFSKGEFPEGVHVASPPWESDKPPSSEPDQGVNRGKGA